MINIWKNYDEIYIKIYALYLLICLIYKKSSWNDYTRYINKESYILSFKHFVMCFTIINIET